MSNYITLQETSLNWGISKRRVPALCKEGRIPGAVKTGRSWQIPVDAQKPVDNRIVTGVHKIPGILIELKAGKDCSADDLKILAQTALDQIQLRQYDTEMKAMGVKTIFKYGVAFCGKHVEICTDAVI